MRTGNKAKEYLVSFPSLDKRIRVSKGTTILDALFFAGYNIENCCGGNGICGGCMVSVAKGQVSRIGEKDSGSGATVPACLTTPESDIHVKFPDSTVVSKQDKNAAVNARTFSDSAKQDTMAQQSLSPLVKKVTLELEAPSVADSRSDLKRISDALEKKLALETIQACPSVLCELPARIRSQNFRITVTLEINESTANIMKVESGNTAGTQIGIAVDIGTTTVVAQLIDLASGGTIDTEACFNSQSRYGAEVTSRIISSEKSGIDRLQEMVAMDINRIIERLCRRNDLEKEDVSVIVAAGNTIMQHLLLGLSASMIRRSPFTSVTLDSGPLPASALGIIAGENAFVHPIAGISSWVGGDITAGLLVTGISKRKEISMLVDIGTNGEIVVGNNEWLMATSSSVGPALEGAGVECGMRAEPGAIERARAKRGNLIFDTINGAPPCGICGSGIIDCLATLVELGVVDRNGKIIQVDHTRVETRNNGRSYLLAKKGEMSALRDVYITEADIENIVTAKAAVYSAMKILLQRLDLKFGDIEKFIIAGSFGRNIDLKSAAAIGLFPNLPEGKAVFSGNTSLNGATMVALNRNALLDIERIRRSTTYYDLLGAEDYVEEFKKALFIPHTDIEEFGMMKK